jgi:hypothetical protein
MKMENRLTKNGMIITALFAVYMGVLAGYYGIEILSWTYFFFFGLPSFLGAFAAQFALSPITVGYWKVRDGRIAQIYEVNMNDGSCFGVRGSLGDRSEVWTKYGRYYTHGKSYNDLIRKIGDYE